MIPLFHRLRLSPVLGFMLVGVAVGPFGLAMLSDQLPLLGAITLNRPESIAPIAELGISMMMFMIGLELSLERLRVMRRLVFGFGLLQFVLCAVAIGGDRLRSRRTAGARRRHRAGAVDVVHRRRRAGAVAREASAAARSAVRRCPFCCCRISPRCPCCSSSACRARTGDPLASSIGPGGGRRAWAYRRRPAGAAPAVPQRARTGSPELFVAACLLVILATGLATAVVGLPMELGSLIAGLLLAETEFRRQIEVTIEPFKGLLVGVFLISVGMSLDLADIAADAPRVVLGAIVLVAVKLAIIACLARGFGLRWQIGLQAGLLLAPGGEFGFVILGLARAEGLIGADVARFPLVLAAATMACIPLLSALGRRMARGSRIVPADRSDAAVGAARRRYAARDHRRVRPRRRDRGLAAREASRGLCRGGQRRRQCRRTAQAAATGLLGRHHADRAVASPARRDRERPGGDHERSRCERPAGRHGTRRTCPTC